MKLLVILVCKGTCATVATPFKGQGGSAPVMHLRSGVPADTCDSKWLFIDIVFLPFSFADWLDTISDVFYIPTFCADPTFFL